MRNGIITFGYYIYATALHLYSRNIMRLMLPLLLLTLTSCSGGGGSTSTDTNTDTNTDINTDTNSPPVAINDTQFNVTAGGTLNVVASSGVLTNDSDADNDSLTAVMVQDPANGSATLQSDGSFEYTHDGSSSTSDSFVYRANDGVADSNPATVSIMINPPPNTAPVAVDDDQFVVNNGDMLTVPVATGVLSNDSDAENDTLTTVLDQLPTNGTLQLNPDGSFEYTHDSGSSTSDSFTYRANDGTDDSNVATVTISINTIPVAGDICGNTAQDMPLAGSVSVTDDDAVFNFSIQSNGSKGFATIDLNTGEFTYTPNTGIRGTDSFTYEVDDLRGGTDSGEIAVIIGDTRIMPLGDSITKGSGDGPAGSSPPLDSELVGYRQKLYLDLDADGYAVDFVGNQAHGSAVTPEFDINHQGIGGIETVGIEPQVIAWLDENPADIVLLHIGTNDVDGTRSVADTVTNLSLILDNINTWADMNNNPVTVFLAKIIQMIRVSDDTTNDDVDQYNQDIETMVNSRNDSDISIILLNQRDALNYPDDLLHDDTIFTFRKHPGSLTNGVSTGGYEKMADTWFQALTTAPNQNEILPNCP